MQSIQINRFSGLYVVVKNTFIDGLAEEELPSRISAMRRRRTAPAMKPTMMDEENDDECVGDIACCDVPKATLPDAVTRFDYDSEASTDGERSSNTVSYFSEGSWSWSSLSSMHDTMKDFSMSAHRTVDSNMICASGSELNTEMPFSAVNSFGMSKEKNTTETSVERCPQESVGSAGHYSGSCRPCVWFWRPTACSKESSCEYCHLCDSGAAQRSMELRQKRQKAAKRKLARRSAGCA